MKKTYSQEVYNYLKQQNNFLQDPKFGGVSKILYQGYSISFVFDEDEKVSDTDQDVNINLLSERFSYVMSDLFDIEKTAKAWKYLPRVMRTDGDGLLGTVTALFSRQDIDIWGYDDLSKSTFESANIKIDLEDLSEIINMMDSAEGIFDFLFRNKFGEFIVIIENVWVFIFLCMENGFSNEKILYEIKKPYMFYHRRRWNLLRPIDKEMLESFTLSFKKTLN